MILIDQCRCAPQNTGLAPDMARTDLRHRHALQIDDIHLMTELIHQALADLCREGAVYDHAFKVDHR